MNAKQYNGWTNYETWVVKLWMDNDEGTYVHWREEARDVYEHAMAQGDQIGSAAYTLAECLKQDHEADSNHPVFKEARGSVYSDLLQAALDEVNWYEIATSLLDDVAEEMAHASTEGEQPDPRD